MPDLLPLRARSHASGTPTRCPPAIAPVLCYPTQSLPRPDINAYRAVRDAATFSVPAGGFFRIISIDGPQVGDLNLFNLHNLEERFYTGKTRALNGTHLGVGDQMFSGFPYLRPMATTAATVAAKHSSAPGHSD